MSDISVIHKLDIKSAPLPVVYEKAMAAISECVDLDECKEWSNKAQALASYARQAADDKLEQMCKRIRARAIRRCGVLLKMFDGKGNNQHKEGTHPKRTKSDAGKEAGLSDWQIKQANNLANIPEDDFDKLVEQGNVPTIPELSDQAKKQAAVNREHLSKPKPEGFAEAIHFRGALAEVLQYTKDYSHEFLLNGMDDDNKTKCVSMMETVKTWFDDFISESKD